MFIVLFYKTPDIVDREKGKRRREQEEPQFSTKLGI